MTTTIPSRRPPEPGDVYWVALDPVIGWEQGGRRPVLVLSDDSLHGMSSRVLICPITANREDWPTNVFIPTGCVVAGALLTDQARMIDRDRRHLRYIGRLPDEITLCVSHRVATYMGIVPARDTS